MMGAMRLAGKNALVTGAASGIGKAVVAAFRAEGAEVIGADVAPADNTMVRMDVSNETDWQRLAHDFEQLDVLVACAGIAAAAPLAETRLEDWRRVMSVNVDGAFLSVKYGAKLMLQRGGGGAIVLVGSASGIKAQAGASAYCASKAAVRMLARTAALEFKTHSVRVNSVSPAGVVTPMWQKMSFWHELVEKHGSELAAWESLGGADPSTPSLRRMALPEEVAAAVVFLSSDESAHITGADLVVDAGYTA